MNSQAGSISTGIVLGAKVQIHLGKGDGDVVLCEFPAYDLSDVAFDLSDPEGVRAEEKDLEVKG